ncbi:hypothetical protein M0R45_018320 [Rubus argutus]|uniref:Uncharacterized protein n=1 Tax=Rubus argutus TaxID=59490 RepID=A0AAW1X3J6_RUBAR
MEANAVIAVELKAMEKSNDKKPVVVVGCADGAKNTAIAASTESTRKLKNKNRIQVSNTKRPLYFYCNLAKRFIKQYNEVELTALGNGYIFLKPFYIVAICFGYDIFYLQFKSSYGQNPTYAVFWLFPTVITISEILKRTGLVVEKKISISTVAGSKDEEKGRIVSEASGAKKLEQTAVAAA